MKLIKRVSAYIKRKKRSRRRQMDSPRTTTTRKRLQTPSARHHAHLLTMKPLKRIRAYIKRKKEAADAKWTPPEPPQPENGCTPLARGTMRVG